MNTEQHDRKRAKAGLCKGRHPMPGVELYVYPQVVENPLDFAALEQQAYSFLMDVLGRGYTHIELYVTGLTMCLTSFLKVAAGNVQVTLMHWDRDTETYVPQEWN